MASMASAPPAMPYALMPNPASGSTSGRLSGAGNAGQGYGASRSGSGEGEGAAGSSGVRASSAPAPVPVSILPPAAPDWQPPPLPSRTLASGVPPAGSTAGSMGASVHATSAAMAASRHGSGSGSGMQPPVPVPVPAPSIPSIRHLAASNAGSELAAGGGAAPEAPQSPTPQRHAATHSDGVDAREASEPDDEVTPRGMVQPSMPVDATDSSSVEALSAAGSSHA